MFEQKPTNKNERVKDSGGRFGMESKTDLGEFAGGKATRFQAELNDLINGENMTDMVGSIGSTGDDEKLLVGVKNEIGFDRRVLSLKNRAAKLLEGYRREMARAVTIGMATVAFSGSADAMESVNLPFAKDGKKLSAVTPLKAGVETDQIQPATSMENPEDLKKETAECVEKIRGELIGHFGSEEFLRMLTVEYGGDAETARKDQAEFVENLETVKANVLPSAEVLAESMKIKNNAKGLGVLSAFYIYDSKEGKHEIFVPSDHGFMADTDPDIRSRDEIIRHELLHAATKGGYSGKQKRIFNDVYRYENGSVSRRLFGKTDRDAYWSDPLEMYVRKKALDRDLERLGIKKYGEKFTEKHYEEMMDAYFDNKLSWDAHDFIGVIKEPYFENLKNVFDELSKNESELDDKPMSA